MGKIKPVCVVTQKGLLDFEKQAVLNGIRELLELAEADGVVEVRDFGVWKKDDYKNEDGSLKPHQSIEWYIQEGTEKSRNGFQLDGGEILGWLIYDSLGQDEQGKHYTALVVHDDMYSGDTNFVVGLASEGVGTVISTFRYEDVDKKTRYECIKTDTMHELSHVFGLVPNSRTENVEESLGKHCMNKCIMRQGLIVPTDSIEQTNDRLEYGALCPTCKTDLKAYFKQD